jgi:hypothetical protein
MYVVVFKPAANTVMTRMFTAGNFMTFARHVFIEELVIGKSFKDSSAANSLITSEQKVAWTPISAYSPAWSRNPSGSVTFTKSQFAN